MTSCRYHRTCPMVETSMARHDSQHSDCFPRELLWFQMLKALQFQLLILSAADHPCSVRLHLVQNTESRHKLECHHLHRCSLLYLHPRWPYSHTSQCQSMINFLRATLWLLLEFDQPSCKSHRHQSQNQIRPTSCLAS